MRMTADTNLLVRVITKDDPAQWRTATDALEKATSVAITLTALCERVWVLQSGHGFSRSQIADAILTLTEISNAEINPSAVEAGLRMLHAGGDFADGVIAFEGQWLGGEVFTSFDKKAVRLLKSHGYETRLLSSSRM